MQILFEAYDPIDFFKSQGHMKPETVRIIKLAITGKFGAAFFSCPFFTFRQQFRGIALLPIPFGDKNAFKVSDRRTLRPLYIIVPQLALCKRNRSIINIFDIACCFVIYEQFAKLFFQIFRSMIRPQLYRQRGEFSRIFNSCSADHEFTPTVHDTARVSFTTVSTWHEKTELLIHPPRR